MEEIAGFSGRWLEIAAAVYLVGMVLHGHYRGFIRLSVSALALVISLVSVRVAVPYVTDWLRNDTKVYDAVRLGFSDGLEGILDDSLANGDGGGAPDAGGSGSGAGEKTVIGDLKLPEQLKELLLKNNRQEVYEMLGVEKFGDYVGGLLADTVVRALASFLIFLAVFLVLRVAASWLDLIARLPILNGLNRIAGAVLGGAEGLVFLWIACLACTAFAWTDFGAEAMRQIAASPWLSWLYNHNAVSAFALGLIKGIV